MESPDTDIPGYGFDPTPEQLLTHYLKQRILDHFNGATQGTHNHLIPDMDINEWDPEQLPRLFRTNSQAVPNRNHCFFFCRPNKKYRNSKRSDRTVLNVGYWKVTCKDRPLSDEDTGAVLGTKKTLFFHRGRAPNGDRTGWVNHEYHLNPTYLGYRASEEMPFVLCRIKKKGDDGDDNDGDEPFEEGTSSSHGGYQTQAPPIQQQEPSGDEDQQIWGSLSSIQNLGSDSFHRNYDNSSYQSSYAEGYYNNNEVCYGNYGGAAAATSTWMPPSPYDNYQDYSNSRNPYN